MTVATDRRTFARTVLKEWVDRQIAANREPDTYVESVGGEDLALYRGGGFQYNEKRIYISETGYLVVWESYRLSRIEDYFLFSRYYEWTETGWAVNIEGDDSVEDEYRPNLHAVEVSTKNLVTVATYLASL